MLSREAYQVRIGAPGGEGTDFTCGFGDESCDLVEVADAINDRFQGRIRATVPAPDTTFDSDSDSWSPDAEISNGSDGGAKATMQIDPYQFQSNKVINSIAQFEVPALVITAYDDHSLPSRHILQLGAVALDANYAISEVPRYDPPPSNGGAGSNSGGGGEGGLLNNLPDPFSLLPDESAGNNAGPVATQGPSNPSTGGAGPLTVPSVPAGPVAVGPDTDVPEPQVAEPEGTGDPVASHEVPARQGLLLAQQKLGEVAPLAALWLLMAFPIHLVVRRRSLIMSVPR
jgi:hypothetical protein